MTDLTCSDCGKGITRGSRTGLCFDCYHGSGHRRAAEAALGSSRLLAAIIAYRQRVTA